MQQCFYQFQTLLQFSINYITQTVAHAQHRVSLVTRINAEQCYQHSESFY